MKIQTLLLLTCVVLAHPFSKSVAADAVPSAPVAPIIGAKSVNVDRACRADVEKFCKGVEHGEGRVMKCLKERKENLSPECKAKIQDAKENFKKRRTEIKELMKACKADKAKFCKDAHGLLKVQKCLIEYQSDTDFSTGCKEELNKE